MKNNFGQQQLSPDSEKDNQPQKIAYGLHVADECQPGFESGGQVSSTDRSLGAISSEPGENWQSPALQYHMTDLKVTKVRETGLPASIDRLQKPASFAILFGLPESKFERRLQEI